MARPGRLHDHVARARLNEVIALVARGSSPIELCELWGISRARAYVWWRRAILERRRRERERDRRVARIEFRRSVSGADEARLMLREEAAHHAQ
jgi:hypothetical protein